MPNIKSAEKRLRQSEKRRERNNQAKAKMKTAIKRVEQALAAGDVQLIREALQRAISVINKTAQKGIIHDNKAARLTSRLTLKVNNYLGKVQPNSTSQPAQA
ncbi:MAG: 30S ribosomal protein S20 [Candidatus Sumerlaeia bacterium]|nr:30S ribosomal protein S20 [Candidatus Sumerlaeia bacterium]